MTDLRIFGALTLSIDEKPGLDRHKWRSQRPAGRNQIVPEISMPRFVVSMFTGSMPSPTVPDGKQARCSRQKINPISCQISFANTLVGYFFNPCEVCADCAGYHCLIRRGGLCASYGSVEIGCCSILLITTFFGEVKSTMSPRLTMP